MMDVNRQMQYLQTKEMNFEDVVGFDKEITRLRNEQEKYLELRAGLYEDLKTGIITQTDFKNFSKIYEKQYIETEKALTRQEDMLKKLFYNGVQSGVKLERLKKKRLPKRWQTIFLMVQQYLSPLVRLLSMLPGRYLTIIICG